MMQKSKILHSEVLKHLIFIICIGVLAWHSYEVYQINKDIDLNMYVEDQSGIRYSIIVSDKAKEEPAFFHRWKCDVYMNQQIMIQELNDNLPDKYMSCKHCRIFGGSCKYYIFEIVPMNDKDKILFNQKEKDTERRNFKITLFCVSLIIVCLIYWYYLYKTNPKEWAKTPFGKVIISINEKKQEKEK